MASVIDKFSKIALADVATAKTDFVLTNEEAAIALQYQTLSTRFASEPESLANFNESLKTKTFVAGNSPSAADLTVFAQVLPLAKSWSAAEDLARYRHVLRWADLVQNTLVAVPESEKLAVDLDAQVPREIKEKKKKEAAPEKGAAEAATKATKADKKAAPSKDAKAGEVSEEEKAKRAEAAKAKKEAKAKAKAEANAKAAAAAVPPNPSMIDFRVGFIQKAVKHPDADSLYVSTIDMGDEEGPRTVCSGLVKYVPLEDMQERYIVTIANLKPVSMRGIKSTAMVLCASNDDTVEFVNPPAGSKPGDKLFFEGFDGTPEKQLNPKKKVWEAVQPGFSTNENFEVTFTEEGKAPVRLVNKKGELCKNTSIVKAQVR